MIYSFFGMEPECKLNNRHPIIKLNFKFCKTSIEFLDTTVYKNKE